MTDILRCSGLATDPSPLLTAQAGGLRVADEVMLVRPGVAEQRARFEIDTTKDVARYPKAALVYGSGSPVWATEVASPVGWQLEDFGTLWDGDVTPLDTTESLTQGFVARGNLYVTTGAGPRKLVTRSAAGVVRAGLPEAANIQTSNSASGSGYAAADLVAFRVCIVRTDANGVFVRSAPSPPVKQLLGGVTGDILLAVTLPQWVDAGDVVEVYRTRVVTSAASIDDATSDVMFLHITATVTTSQANNGLMSMTDTNNGGNPNERGAELYTNSTREGILKGNYDPPASVACASWQSLSWWGNVMNPQRVVLTFSRAPGYFSTTATFGTPVTVITVASAANLAIGQVVSESAAGSAYGTFIAAGTRITDISGTSVTIDTPTVGVAAGDTLYFHDAIAIEGDVYYATSTEDINNRRFLGVNGGGGVYYTGKQTVLNSFCEVVCRYQTGSGPANDYYAYVIPDLGLAWLSQALTVVIRKADPTATAMVVDAESLALQTNSYSGAAAVSWSPVFGDDPATLTDTTYRHTNRVYWSKPDEPEAVPLVSYLRLGDETTRVLALTPMRSAMLVWTTRGTYRISGSPPDGWRVDLVDPDCRLVRGEAVSTEGGVAYAWTDRGIVRSDESGIGQSISDGLIGQELEEHTRRVLQVASDSTAAWVRSWRRLGVIVVGVPSADLEVSGDRCAWLYVYHTGDGGWTRWMVDRAVYAGAEDISQGRFYISMADQVNAWHTRINREYVPNSAWTGYDGVYSLTVGGMVRVDPSTLTITDAARGEWIPRPCDWLGFTPEGTPQYFRITSAVQGSGIYTITVDGTLPAVLSFGGWTAYEGIESIIHWQGLSAGSPGMTMQASDVRTLEDWSDYESGFGPADVLTEIGASTDRVSPAEMMPKTETLVATPSRTLRIQPSREVSRCAHLYPRWQRCSINLPWRLLGVAVKIAPVSERTNR